jgi:2-phospho-L-lactate/phosphoenolpyruvate guanylyltransferase
LKATAVLPVKRFAEAKQRLAPGIGATHRAELAAAMMEDVLEAIGAARSIERTIVITSEPRAIELAAASGAEVLPDPDVGGHSGAALAGISRARELGSECVVLLPIDCPLLATRELERLLTGMPERYVAIVPDRHGTGTNALALTPPDAIEPSFGEGSCARHVAAARAAGIPFNVEELPSLALDLDTPADVVALTMALERDHGGAKRTAKALGI